MFARCVLTTSLWMTSGVLASAQEVAFHEHVVVGGGNRTASADMNGDGTQDLVRSGGRFLYWNSNDGQNPPTFTADATIGDLSQAIDDFELGDMDSDGDMDVVAFGSKDGDDDDPVAWFENDGSSSPTFTRHIIPGDAVYGTDLALGDVNGDGHLDIVTCGYRVYYRLNDGAADPSFTRYHVDDDTLYHERVFLVDFNNNGHLDVLHTRRNPIEIRLSVNDGAAIPSFATSKLFDTASFPDVILAGDIDNNGTTDVFYNDDGYLVCRRKESSSWRLDVLTSYEADSATLGSLDGDGRLDLVISNYESSSWFEWDPIDYRFVETPFAGGRHGQMVCTDLDQDGKDDLLTIQGNGTRWFQSYDILNLTSLATDTSLASAITAASSNDELMLRPGILREQPDVHFFGKNLTLTCAGTEDAVHAAEGTLSITAYPIISSPAALSLEGSISVGFAASPAFTATTTLEASGDISIADNGSMLVFAPESTLPGNISLGTGSSLQSFGNLTLNGGPLKLMPKAIGLNSVTDVEAADLDGDGDQDLLTVGQNLEWLEDDDGLFIKRALPNPPGVRAAATGDLDADGDVDFALGSNGALEWFENDGSGTFTSIAVEPGATDDVAIVDVNGDGHLDIVAVSPLAWFENDGGANPTFTKHGIDADGVGPLCIFDIDSDGDADIACQVDFGTKILTWFENDGTGAFFRDLIDNAALNISDIAAGDLSGEGYVDLVVTSDNMFRYYDGHPGPQHHDFNWWNINTAGSPRSVEIAELSGDDRLDLVVSVAGSEDEVVLLINENIDWYVADFSPRPLASVNDPNTLLLADLGNDGDLDLVTSTDTDDQVVVLENRFDGMTFQEGGIASTGSITSKTPLQLADSYVTSVTEIDFQEQVSAQESTRLNADVLGNARIIDVDGSLVRGTLTNNEMLDLQAGTMTIEGDLISNATIQKSSNPGDLEVLGDVILHRLSHIRFDGDQQRLVVGGAWDVAIDRRGRFALSNTQVEMRPDLTPVQHFEVMSKDRGNVRIGLDPERVSSFPLQQLRIGSGSITILVDHHDNDREQQGAPEAVYVDRLVIESGATLVNPNHKIYYRTLSKQGAISHPHNVIKIDPRQEKPGEPKPGFGTATGMAMGN